MNEYCVANCGDSRGVFCVSGKPALATQVGKCVKIDLDIFLSSKYIIYFFGEVRCFVTSRSFLKYIIKNIPQDLIKRLLK